MDEKVRQVLENMPFWNKLEEQQRNLLLNNSRLINYQVDDRVYSGAGECLGMIFILEGSFRTYLLSDEGKEVTMYRLGKGDTCVLAASCILSAITFEVEIQAQEPTEALVLPAGMLARLTEENVYLENFIYKEAAKRFSDVVEALQQMMFFSLTQRVAAFLLDESAKKRTLVISMTHEEIAKMIGSAREAVSRILKGMVKKGWITLNRGEIKIQNKGELYRILE